MEGELVGPCIEWMKGKDAYGYGNLSLNGKVRKAHRLAYCEHRGIALEEIDGFVVRHRCDNRGCVNPEHLVLGSQADNVRDMYERHRNANQKGEAHGRAKLTADQVKQIKAEYVKGHSQFGQPALAEKYGVTRMTISAIITGRNWRHLGSEQIELTEAA
jgi:hypothetical protein